MKKLLFILLIALILFPACNRTKKYLDIYLWEDSMPEEVLDGFRYKGVKIEYTGYDNNEELYSTVRFMDKGKYDVIMPSSYMISLMRKKSTLSVIDTNKLENIDNVINSYLRQPYGIAKQYSIPYVAGSMGIIVNTKYINPEEIKSWDDLWLDKYAGQIILHDDMRDIFAIALKSLGYSGNSMKEEEIEEAYNKLVLLFGNIDIDSADDVSEHLIDEKYYVATMYQDEAYWLRKEHPYFKFIIPWEGSVFWIDTIAIPSSGDNVDVAYKFIDYLLTPEVAAEVVEYSGAVPMLEYNVISPYLSKGMLEEYNNFFKNYSLRRMELQQDVGLLLQVYAKYWRMLLEED